jgi:hypothetical protein
MYTYIYIFIYTYLYIYTYIHIYIYRSRRACTRQPPSTLDAFHDRTRTRMHALLIHTYARTHVPSRARLVRARSRPARPRVGASAGPCERGGAGTHSEMRSGQSTVAGSAASSLLDASLRAHCAAAPGGSGPPLTARRSAARTSHAHAGLGRGRRPETPPPPHPTPRGSALAPGAAAPRAAAGTAANAHRRRRARDAQFPQELALAEPLGERIHLRGADGPAAHRARVRPAPAAQRWADVGPNGPKPWKVAAHALNTHPHA